MATKRKKYISLKLELNPKHLSHIFTNIKLLHKSLESVDFFYVDYPPLIVTSIRELLSIPS